MGAGQAAMGPSANGTTNYNAMHGEKVQDLEPPSAADSAGLLGPEQLAAAQEEDDGDEAQVTTRLVLYVYKLLRHKPSLPSVNNMGLVCSRLACGFSLLSWSSSSPVFSC